MNELQNVKIEGHIGTWYSIETTVFMGMKLYLMESEQFGDEANCIIINDSNEIMLEDVCNGFNDFYEYYSV